MTVVSTEHQSLDGCGRWTGRGLRFYGSSTPLYSHVTNPVYNQVPLPRPMWEGRGLAPGPDPLLRLVSDRSLVRGSRIDGLVGEYLGTV